MPVVHSRSLFGSLVAPSSVPAPVDFGVPAAPVAPSIRIGDNVYIDPFQEESFPEERAAPEHRATASSVAARLSESDTFVAFAVALVYSNQTADERSEGRTRHQNGRGFNGADAGYGSYLARWVTGRIPHGAESFEVDGRRFRPLSGKHLRNGRRLIAKYAGQVAETLNAQLGL